MEILFHSTTALRDDPVPLRSHDPDAQGFVEIDFVWRKIVFGTWSADEARAAQHPTAKAALRYPVPANVRGAALADLFEAPRCRVLVERIFYGAVTLCDGRHETVMLSRDARAAEAQLLDLLATLHAETAEVREVADWLPGAQALLDIWRGEPLEDALERLEDRREADDYHAGIIVVGDLRAALLNETRAAFKRGEPVDRFYVAALEEHGLIGQDEAAAWHSQQKCDDEDSQA
ncbi:hypothetical protein E4K72_14235 [Oxalobacteraceae bacterium OM1]|nr:hypothetical protein E4K72_14235 [Oxalobacteraceae bacterium OM1]